MECRMREMRCKEVINICDGCRLGYVADVELKMPEGQVCAIIVYGPYRFSACSEGERSITFPGIAFSASEMTSS